MSVPIYQQIIETLRKEIEQMSANTPILSERELEKKYDASRMTIRRAINELVDEGILYRINNVGTFVSDPKLHKKKENVAPLFNAFDDSMEYKIIYFDVKDNMPEVQEKLEISKQDLFIRIVRLNLKEGVPESVDQIYIVRKMVDSSVMNDIKGLLKYSANLETGSVNQVFVPMIVPVKFANLMKIKINTPIIRVDSKVVTQNGRIYAYIQSFLNPDTHDLELTF